MIDNPWDLSFAPIPAGTFMMGSPPGQASWFEGEDRHQVTISRSFYLQTMPVTRAQWRKIMGGQGSDKTRPEDADLPAANVSWFEARDFIDRLNRLEDAAGYRLPTEAEWEYACRAGSTGAWCFGDDQSRLTEYAWYQDNSGERPHPPGLKKPNAWGLFDMHGNVPEWCEDIYQPYPPGPALDPRGLETESERIRRQAPRVVRGGSFLVKAIFIRSAARNWLAPQNRRTHTGFRLALDGAPRP